MGITRESYLIAMASQSSPTMKDDGAMVSTLSSLIKEDMVAPESLAQCLCIRAGKILLPIKPPKIYTFTFMISDDILEERLGKIGIVQTPLNSITVKILAIQIISHLREILRRLHLVDTISRVQIECSLKVLTMHLSQQAFRVWQQIGVPRPASPSSPTRRLTIVVTIPMPVHI